MISCYWIEADRLAGRQGPNQVPWDLSALALRFDLVISLTERMLNRSNEFAEVGLDHVCIPLPKNRPPLNGDKTEIKIILPLLFDLMKKELSRGRRVLVHCSSGKDRTALVLAYYLMRERGISPEDAAAKIVELKPNAFSALGWHELALATLSELAGSNDSN